MIYFMILLLLAVVNCKLNCKNEKLLSNIILIGMFFLTALRGENVCPDTFRYIAYASSSGVSRFGIVHDTIRDFNNMLGGFPQMLLIIYALLTFIPLFIIVRYEDNIKISLFILLFFVSISRFYNETFNLAREMIAVMFFLLAGWAIYYEKKIVSIFLMIFAVLIHNVVIFSLPFILLAYYLDFKLTKKKLLVVLLLSMVVGFVNPMQYVTNTLEILDEYFKYSGDGGIDYGRYVETESYITEWNWKGQLSNMAPIVMLCYFSFDVDDNENFFFKIFFLGTVACCCLVNSTFVLRLVSPLTVFQLLSISMIYKNKRINRLQYLNFVIFFMLVMYIVSMISYQLSPISRGVLPYKFFFE